MCPFAATRSVSSQTVTALPLSSRNYTQIMALSAGTNTGANNATALGKGTQNMSVNGNDPGQDAQGHRMITGHGSSWNQPP